MGDHSWGASKGVHAVAVRAVVRRRRGLSVYESRAQLGGTVSVGRRIRNNRG